MRDLWKFFGPLIIAYALLFAWIGVSKACDEDKQMEHRIDERLQEREEERKKALEEVERQRYLEREKLDEQFDRLYEHVKEQYTD